VRVRRAPPRTPGNAPRAALTHACSIRPNAPPARLAQLDDAAARIAAMTKQTADGYARNAAEFVRAARAAKAVQRDLESATRRIAYVFERARSRRALSSCLAARR
jgi:diacylglycerol kinase family enzyme